MMKTAAQTGAGGAFTNSFLRSGANNTTIKIKISLKSILTRVTKMILNFTNLSFLVCTYLHGHLETPTCVQRAEQLQTDSHQNHKRAFNMAVKFNY